MRDPPARSRSSILIALARLLPVLAVGAAGVFVYRGALELFFAQDDFAGLARARGVIPALSGPWRYVSGQAYFDAMEWIGGLDSLRYHAVSLLAHAATAMLLFAFLRRSIATPAAWVGSVLFAVHPALFTAVYSVSGIGEILALGFGIGALGLAPRTDPWRWGAVPLFALSLLSKESTLLLPLALLLERAIAAPGSRQRRLPLEASHRAAPLKPGARATARARNVGRDPLLLALSALSMLYLASFVVGDSFSIRRALPQQAPYHLAFDATLGRNLLTYVGWAVHFSFLTVQSVTDSVDPRVWPYGAAGLGFWIAGLFSKALRDRGWLAGGALFLTLLAPVLPLSNHTYHYYLYAPLAGMAWLVAALFDVAARFFTGASAGPRSTPARSSAQALVWTLAAAINVLFVVNGALLVHKIETFPFLHPALRGDPTVDRSRIARNALHDLGAAALVPGERLRFLFHDPTAPPTRRDPERESYWESNVRGALLDGLAVRVFFPDLGEIGFARTFQPADISSRVAVYGVDGHLRVLGSTQVDSLMRAASTP